MASPTFVNFGPFLLRKLVQRSRIFDLWLGEIRGESNYMSCLIRRMLPPYTSGVEYIRIFQARCREVRGFEHPAVLLPLESDVVNDIPYAVFELVRGWNLDELIDYSIAQNRAFPLELVLKFVFPLAHALACAHMRPSFPLIHGALTPGSIWISMDGSARLADFELGGLAEFELGSNDRSGESDWRFQAPERATAWAKPSASVDTYSLAAVLLRLLVPGRLSAVQLKLETGDQLAILYAQKLPVDLLKLIAACQAEPAANRPDMAAVVQTLKQLSGSLPRNPSTSTWLSLYSPPVNEVAQLARPGPEVAKFLKEIPRGENTFTEFENTVLADNLTPLGARPRASSTTGSQPAWKKLVQRPAAKLALGGLLLLGVVIALGTHPEALSGLLDSRGDRVLVVVDSDPSGASIELPDGRALGVTPLKVPFQLGPSQQIALTARKDGWIPQGPISRPASPGGEVTFSFKLERSDGTASARILSTPPGAKVIIDGKLEGVTPFLAEHLPENREHRLVASINGRSVSQTFRVEEQTITEVKVDLERRSGRARRDAADAEKREASTAYLVLQSFPVAQINIDGRARGQTASDRKLKVPAGRHVIELQSSYGAHTAPFEITLQAGDTQVLEYDFNAERWHMRAGPTESQAP